LESLNVILSSFAERGDVLDALHVLDIMRRYGLKPNADSYSFAVEVLGKDMVRRNRVHDFAWVQRSIDTADSLLTKMEENETAPSSDVIRNYVELLCIAGEVSTANAVVDDCLSNERRSLISNKTLYRLATANADAGNFEIAKRLASMTSEVIPVLHRKIKSKEQRYFHLTQSKENGGRKAPR
jgi:pentatricopeptide repeat protein